MKPDIAKIALLNDEALPSDVGLIGIVSLEDVLEELLQEEIYDENDYKEVQADVRARRVVKRWKAHIERKRAEKSQEKSNLERSAGGEEPTNKSFSNLYGLLRSGNDSTDAMAKTEETHLLAGEP